MSFLNLCNDDPLLKVLKDALKANPIRIPEERIKPLIVLSKQGNNNKFIGDIKNLLENNTHVDIPIENSQMADISSTRSKKIDASLGLQVLDNFLKGFGSKAASIEFAFNGAKTISFSFDNVQRQYIDLGTLGKVLVQKKVDISNPVIQNFIEEKSECIILDSVITSNNFSIRVEDEYSTGFSFNIPEINKVLSSLNNDIKVSSSSSLEITFNGSKQLAFAFTCLLVNIDDEGHISFDGEPDKMTLTKEPVTNYPQFNCEKYILNENFGLNYIDFDE